MSINYLTPFICRKLIVISFLQIAEHTNFGLRRLASISLQLTIMNYTMGSLTKLPSNSAKALSWPELGRYAGP